MRFLKKLKWGLHQKRWFGKWHLYIGIIAGAILCIVGLTGSILVFQDEIDAALNKEMFHVLQSQKRYSLEEIIPLVQKKYPELKFDYAMYGDRDNLNASYKFYDFKSDKEFFVNPYDLSICGKRVTSSSFIRIVMNLHRFLLIPPVGRYIVAFATLCMLVLTISGLRLWVPQQYKKWKQWKSVLTINFKAGFKRQNYDWHNVLGIYSAPVVIMLALSGFAITFSTVFIAFLFMLTGQSPQSVATIFGQKSDTTVVKPALSVIEVLKLAKKAVPYADLVGVALPEGKSGIFRLDMSSASAAKTGNRVMVIADQYTGKIFVNSEKDFPNVGNSYLTWLVPIHYGTFGGMPTRILAFIGGLIPLLLYITGFIIWWPRFKKQNKKKNTVAKTKVQYMSAEGENIGRRTFFPPVKKHFMKGLKYAAMSLPASFISGALYGIISGVIIAPGLFAVVYVGICVIVNMILALLTGLITLLFLTPFEKGDIVYKYMFYSLAFGLVFIPAVLIISNWGLKVF